MIWPTLSSFQHLTRLRLLLLVSVTHWSTVCLGMIFFMDRRVLPVFCWWFAVWWLQNDNTWWYQTTLVDQALCTEPQFSRKAKSKSNVQNKNLSSSGHLVVATESGLLAEFVFCINARNLPKVVWATSSISASSLCVKSWGSGSTQLQICSTEPWVISTFRACTRWFRLRGLGTEPLLWRKTKSGSTQTNRMKNNNLKFELWPIGPALDNPLIHETDLVRRGITEFYQVHTCAKLGSIQSTKCEEIANT